jgi:class 3 adenylate cyclase/PAS domain-containing protein
MAGIVGAMSSVTVLVCVVVVLIVLFGLMPSVKNVDAERDSMFGLLATLDKSVLKQQYEDAKSKVKSERHQAQGQVRSNGPLAIGSSMAGSSTTSTASRSTPFIITAVLILLYSLLFAVLLSLYIADLYAVNVYVSQFPLLESSATRSHAMVLEALAPTPSPFGTNAAVRRLISRFANEMIDSWSQIGQGKTGIAFKSPELHQAMLEPSCTLGVSGKEQSCKSLEDTVLDLHDRLSYFGTSTDANDFSVSGTAFNEYRVPLRDHLPVKLNVAYNAFVDYYNARANAYRAVAIGLMVIAVIMFPIVYYLGAHRPMKNLQRDHLLVRGLFLLVPMNVAEGHAQIWAYITGTDFDIGQNAGSAASRKDKNMDKFAESLVASAKQSFFVVHRLKGYIMFGNPAASELTGMSADALMGLHFEDLLKDASELRRLLSSSGSFTFEAVLESGQCPVEVHLTVPSSAQAHVLITMRDQTMEKKSSRLLVEEKKRGIELLHSILPPPVALKLMGDERPIAFSHDAVCTLFCDIVGFTPLTSQQSAQQTVAMLDLLFSQFDEAARKNSCTRIKSIGDCAFLCCGITVEGVPIDPGVMPNQRRNLVRDMVETAKEMISIAQRQDIQVRIGVNIGPAISGVIGRDKFAFDLWGDSVNVASRMESTSEPGRIHLSRAAYEHVYDMYKCEERSVDVKGKGTMQTYLMH